MTNYRKRQPQTLNCKECGELVKNVGEQASWVICWKCVSKSLEEFNKNNKNNQDVQSDLRDS